MMHGALNADRLCKVLEQIFSQRDPDVEVHVKVISEEEGTKPKGPTIDSLDQSVLDE